VEAAVLSSQEEQREREEVMRQDADLRKRQEEAERRAKDQSGTFFSHTDIYEITGGGRFASESPVTVVGQDPQIKYPQLPASSPWSGAQPEPGIEPPLSAYENSALDESSAVISPVEEGAPAADEALASEGDRPSAGVQASPPPTGAVETVSAGAPPFAKGTDNG
jgi:hypothetical protein